MIMISFWSNELGMKGNFFFSPVVEGFHRRSFGEMLGTGLGAGRVGRLNAEPQQGQCGVGWGG